MPHALLALLLAAQPDDPLFGRARALHAEALLFDGHNDLPWRLRDELHDFDLTRTDLSQRLPDGHTDIPRLREGGLKAQFWSVYIPGDHPHPARTVIEQIDLVYRMIDKYSDVFELALTADDVERIAASGKIAGLIGIEGGVAIENSLPMLRAFHRLGARYMTLTHNQTLDWADAATDEPRHDGLSPFGEEVVREMNRLGMLVDLSHVSPAVMDDVLRISTAPVIFSHSSAYAIAPHPRNVPDEILRRLPANGGVVMVNFFPGFVVKETATALVDARRRLRAEHPDDPAAYAAALDAWFETEAPKLPRGTVADVADHIDHIVQLAGIDHVGIGSDFDGISSTPSGLEDVSCYPNLTAELLRRGYSEADLKKILGGNILRVLRQATSR
ncbi:MAG: dipeptidase [Isosphaeraceae bacterium]|jgi:membrane dipeptidase|nr:MAG: dipeptidase [Isosphaeraceae bacterium]